MTRLKSAVLGFLMLPLSLAAHNAAVQKELLALEGNWKLVRVLERGQEVAIGTSHEVTARLCADGTATARIPAGEIAATATPNPAGDPKTMEIRHESGRYRGSMPSTSWRATD